MLALLQEEEAIPSKKRSYSKSEGRDHFRSKWHSRGDETTRQKGKHSEAVKGDDKLEALKSFRRSKGLCFTCGDKWNHNHKCPAKVPLHGIEELLEVLQIQSHPDMPDTSASESDEEPVMLLGDKQAVAKIKKAFRLQGNVGKHQLLIHRSEERRVGKECRIGCRSRWSPYH